MPLNLLGFDYQLLLKCLDNLAELVLLNGPLSLGELDVFLKRLFFFYDQVDLLLKAFDMELHLLFDLDMIPAFLLQLPQGFFIFLVSKGDGGCRRGHAAGIFRGEMRGRRRYLVKLLLKVDYGRCRGMIVNLWYGTLM